MLTYTRTNLGSNIWEKMRAYLKAKTATATMVLLRREHRKGEVGLFEDYAYWVYICLLN